MHQFGNKNGGSWVSRSVTGQQMVITLENVDIY
jgi:hypothetical protein